MKMIQSVRIVIYINIELRRGENFWKLSGYKQIQITNARHILIDNIILNHTIVYQ